VRKLLKLLAWSFVLLIAWLILESTPTWGLQVIILVLALWGLNMMTQRDAWSKRYLIKAGYNDWSQARSEISQMFIDE
jgi:hypothetical protein